MFYIVYTYLSIGALLGLTLTLIGLCSVGRMGVDTFKIFTPKIWMAWLGIIPIMSVLWPVAVFRYLRGRYGYGKASSAA
jgi:hypothetical protein